MTAPALTVHEWRPRPNPLAYREGIRLLDLMIAAGARWRPLTAVQRDVLVAAVHPVLAELEPGADVPEVRLDAGVRPPTIRALARRQLVTVDGVVTPLGVQVTCLAVPVQREVAT